MNRSGKCGLLITAAEKAIFSASKRHRETEMLWPELQTTSQYSQTSSNKFRDLEIGEINVTWRVLNLNVEPRFKEEKRTQVQSSKLTVRIAQKKWFLDFNLNLKFFISYQSVALLLCALGPLCENPKHIPKIMCCEVDHSMVFSVFHCVFVHSLHTPPVNCLECIWLLFCTLRIKMPIMRCFLELVVNHRKGMFKFS